MTAKNILVVGAGFAGLWAALGAARKLDEQGVGPERVRVSVVNRDAWHSIRVRNYEQDLSGVRVPLDEVLGPAGVARVEGEAVDIDLQGRSVRVETEGATRTLPYDRLIFAPGSRLHVPDIPGLVQNAFDVDTFAGGERLNRHIAGLEPGSETVLVIGAGPTGIEAACEMPEKLKAAGVAHGRVILADGAPQIGPYMGDEARPVIEHALAALGIETRAGVRLSSVDEAGVTLEGGERIGTRTLVWCGGMRASPLTGLFPIERDRWGRLPVDEFMRVPGVDAVFAAGDAAAAPVDGSHVSVMSCQHGRPMGRYAGHNAAADLLGLDMLPLSIGYYVTCLDLGPWGALYTEGWDRRVVASGPEAKKTKETINRIRIYPPRSGDRRELLDAAAPEVQAPPIRK